jgi:3-hydroxymyristoyl/3-hydroxydecanoyl-(acyl carrier protein) dehydratase
MNARSAWLRVASDHPALAGHFPGHPIVPGALLLDEALHAIDGAATSWHIASLKFHRIVRPDEALRLEFSTQPGGALRIELRAGEALVMSGLLERRPP